MHRILIVLGLALTLAAPATAQEAQEAQPARTYTPTHLAAARAYFGVVHTEQMQAEAADAMLDQSLRANPQLAPFRETIRTWAREFFASDETKSALDEVAAETFTEADLRALTTFWGSPLGQRYLKAQPVLRAGGVAALRANGFTEADLRSIAAFFATPLGRRYVSQSPVLQRRTQEVGQQLANARRAELMERLEKVQLPPSPRRR